MFQLTNVIPERIIFISQGITVFDHPCAFGVRYSIGTCETGVFVVVNVKFMVFY